jgi:hypothetical protein
VTPSPAVSSPISCLIVGVALAALALPSRADPALYSAKEIRGRVVDGVSGEPLAGVIVVAQWELVREIIPGVIHRFYGDVLKTIEVVSGPDGGYVIPAWGPAQRPAFFHLEDGDPMLEVFTPGYYPRHVSNRIRAAYSRDSVRVSQWDGRAMPLRKFTGQPQEYLLDDGQSKVTVKVDGTLEEYASKLSTLQIYLHWTRETDDWKSYPRMVMALTRERERLDALGLAPKYQIDRVTSLHGNSGPVPLLEAAPYVPKTQPIQGQSPVAR